MTSRRDTPAVLVARFLRNNNYDETLKAFLSEANLSPNVGLADADDPSSAVLTLEQVLDEKQTFDLSRNLEKVELEDDLRSRSWNLPSPCKPTSIDVGSPSSNILHVSVSTQHQKEPVCVITTALRSIQMKTIDKSAIPKSYPLQLPNADSPVLDCVWVSDRHFVYACMSGLVAAYDLVTGSLVEERRDHTKYVVCVTTNSACGSENTAIVYLATAGWDGKIFLYKITPGNDQLLGAPIAHLDLPSTPECARFIQHPEIDGPVLLVARRNSSFLYYFSLSSPSHGASDGRQQLYLLGQQNLAPHSLTWTPFSPCWLAMHPQDGHICAVATNTAPSMKLLLVRLLLPPPKMSNAPSTPGPSATSSGLAALTSLTPREKQLVEDRDDSAILLSATTHAPQTEHSTPRVAFRPSGRGVWVNGDDGIVRGIELSTGKVVARLGGIEDGGRGANTHKPGSRVRCLWAGTITHPPANGDSGDGGGSSDEEILISGGFDRQCIIWRV